MLIRDKEITGIISELFKTNHWEEVALEKKYTDDYLQPPPRIIKCSDNGFSIKFWTETATHLIVDLGSNACIEVPDCEALNSVLVEEDMHPDPDTGNFRRPFLLTKPDTRFLPHHPCQSPTRCPHTKIYIPTISHYITALVAQIQWLDENGYGSLIGYGPESDLLVRYLFLEIPSQRKKLLPQLDNKTRTRVERILDRYKRTHKLKISDISTQIMRIVSEEVESAVLNKTQDELGGAVVISAVGA